MSDPQRPSDFSVRFRQWVIGAFAATFIVHLFIDVFLTTYEGTSTSFLIGGIVGTALGLRTFFENRGGGES